MDVDTGVATAFGYGSGLVNIVFWILIACLIIGVIWFVTYLFSFKIKVIIKDKIGAPFDVNTLGLANEIKTGVNGAKIGLNGEVLRFQEKVLKGLTAIPTKTKSSNGRIIKKNGRYRLEIFRWFKGSLRLKIPNSLYVNLGMGDSKRIEFLKLSQHFYAPIVTIYDKEIFEKAEFEDSFIDWLVQDIEDDKAKYNIESFWSKHGAMIMQVGILVLMFIMLIVTFRYSQDLANTNAQASQALAGAVDKLAGSCVQTV